VVYLGYIFGTVITVKSGLNEAAQPQN